MNIGSYSTAIVSTSEIVLWYNKMGNFTFWPTNAISRQFVHCWLGDKVNDLNFVKKEHLFCWKWAPSNNLILLYVSVIFSVKINTRLYFWSVICASSSKFSEITAWKKTRSNENLRLWGSVRLYVQIYCSST